MGGDSPGECDGRNGTAETLTITGSTPAGAHGVNDLVSIAVEHFDGPDGAALSDAIENELGKVRFGNHPYFRVVAPESRIAVDGLLTGSVRTAVEEQTVLEKRTRCTEYDPADKKKRIKEIEVDIRCRQRVATFNANVRLVGMGDGSVCYSRPDEFARRGDLSPRPVGEPEGRRLDRANCTNSCWRGAYRPGAVRLRACGACR